MTTALAIMSAIVLLPGLFIVVLLRKLRRAGRPDRLGELAVGAWMVHAVVRVVLLLAWPDAPPWTWFVTLVPALLICFGVLVARVRQYPEALFSPETIARVRGWSEKVRGR